MAGICLITMEVIWAALVFALLAGANHPIPYGRAWLALEFIYLLAYFSSRLGISWQLKKSVRRVLVGIVLGFSLWFSLEVLLFWPRLVGPFTALGQLWTSFSDWTAIPVEFVLLLAILLLWRRAVTLARQPVYVDVVLGSFQWGVLMLFLFSLAPGLVDPQGSIGLELFIPFMFLGLFGMAAARIGDLSDLRGGRRLHFGRGWLLAIGLSVLGVVGVAFGFAQLLNGPLGALLYQLVVLILGVIGGLTLLLVMPLMSWLMEFVRRFSAGIDLTQFNRDMQGLLSQLQELAQKQKGGALDELIRMARASQPYMLVGILAALAAAILLAMGLRRVRRALRGLDQGETILSAGDLAQQLRDAARRRAQELLDALNKRLRLTQAARLIQAARIRWVYAQLMELCEKQDHPRPQADTPLEFLVKMERFFPQYPAELALITHAYLKVRYGELPESPQEVDEVLAAWERVKGAPGSLARKKA